MANGQYRRWVFTSYDPTIISHCESGGDPTRIQALLKDMSFCIYQLERCPETLKLHVQGYSRFSRPKRLGGVRSMFEAHWEGAKGNEQANIKYCSKTASREAGPWRAGLETQQGKRKDLEVARELIKSCGKIAKVAEVVSSYQALKGAEVLIKYLEPKRNFKPEVRWYHGSTGAGKTRDAMEEFPDAYMSGKNLKWWEGYDAHDAVVVDDFRADFCTFHELLRILDRYEYRVEVKGGSRQLLAKTIIITCPYHPSELYKNRSEEDIGQLLRRIDTIKLYGNVVNRNYPNVSINFREN